MEDHDIQLEEFLLFLTSVDAPSSGNIVLDPFVYLIFPFKTAPFILSLFLITREVSFIYSLKTADY